MGSARADRGDGKAGTGSGGTARPGSAAARRGTAPGSAGDKTEAAGASLAAKAPGRERRTGFRAAGAAASKLAAPVIARRGGGILVRLKAEWAAIIGPDWAERIWPQALSRDGVLKLRIGAGAALEAQHRAPLILQRLNGFLGRDAITRLSLVQGVVPQPNPPRLAGTPSLDARQAAILAAKLSGVADPELRAALDRLGRAVAAASEEPDPTGLLGTDTTANSTYSSKERSMRVILATLAAIFLFAGLPVQAQGPSAASPPGNSAAGTLEITKDDRILGKADAPVTIIEYASLTCPHCAHFEREILPKIKAAWIDTGKARLIYRDYPLDRPAAHAALLARCAPPEKYYGFIDALFSGQDGWAMARDSDAALARIAKLGGIGDEQFKACMANKALEDQIFAVQLRAQKELGIESTPTFFVNGRKIVGAQPYEDFEKILMAAAPKT